METKKIKFFKNIFQSTKKMGTLSIILLSKGGQYNVR